VLIANQFSYPLQFVLYFPFVRMGEWVFNQPPVPFSFDQITQVFSEDVVKAISLVGWSTLYGLVVWFLLSWPLVYGLRLLFKVTFEKTVYRNAATTHQEAIPK
jgi:hypothetical protein